MHTNEDNGKVYIGKTVQKPQRRFRNGEGYKKSPHFYSAIKKHGWDKFKFTELEVVTDIKLLAEREEYYIKLYNSIDPNIGYNIVKIDKGLNSYPDEVKEKISKAKIDYYKNLTKPVVAHNKNHHIYEKDGTIKKRCTKCQNIKHLSEFQVDTGAWDGLLCKCRECQITMMKKYKDTYKKTSQAEINQSYKDRGQAISIGLKLKAQTSDYGKKISERNSKPIVRIYPEGTTKIYNNTYELKVDGLSYEGVRKSIKTQNEYKGSRFKYQNKIDRLDDKYLIFDEELLIENKVKIWASIKKNNKNVIYARKCIIKELNHAEQFTFCETNHLQGGCTAKYKYGLIYENEIVAVMTFAVPRYNKKYQWELIRFCSKLNTRVIGGASKLLKHFIRNINPKSIISYANLRFSDGGLYEKLGFTLLGKSQTNYFYIKDGIMYNRTLFQKSKLKRRLGDKFDPKLTEKENMYKNGYTVKNDRGNLIYVLTL